MREIIPDGWGLVGKGALAIGFGACGWDFKKTGICRRSKRAIGGIGFEKVREIAGRSSVEISKTKCGNFVLDSLLYWQPVKGLKKRSYMVILRRTKNEAGSMILHTLKLIDDIVGRAREKGITIVKTGKNKGAEQSFSCLIGEEMANGSDATDFEEAGTTEVSNVLMKGEGLVKSDA